MPKLPAVPTGKLALAASWFRSVRDRIEEIVPLAGDGIKVEQSSSGIKISLDSGDNGLELYTLDICVNGSPTTIDLYGPKGQD